MLVSSLIIAIAIFLLGFYLGYFLDNYRVDDATNILVKAELDSEAFVTSQDFYRIFSKQDCDFSASKLEDVGKQLAYMGQILTKYDANKLSHKQSYNNLKRKYFISELNFYNMKKEHDNKCGIGLPILLFFYNTKNNGESLRGGYVLDILVNKNNISVLSFDKDFDDYAVISLVKFYNITYAPTLIVNYNKKLEGFTSEAELRGILYEEKNK